MINTIALSVAFWALGVRNAIISRIKSELGQDILEYAVLAGAIGLIAAFVFFTDVIDFEGAVTQFGAEVADCIGLTDECGSGG